VRAELDADPTGNPLDRLKLSIDSREARISAWDLADALANPPTDSVPVIVRDHEAELNFFFVDPCNLHPGQQEIVLQRLLAELERAQHAPQPLVTPFFQRDARRVAGRRSWPD
jgi:L-seryl-tRNA(Ser) seleniumtransferase